MFETMVHRQMMLAILLGSALLHSQQLPQPSTSSTSTDFPVVMRQNIVAGKTPVGSKVQANLVAATLVNGVVVPRNAVLSGEVTESVKKSASAPSRLAIRMDSAEWKKGSAPIKAVFDCLVLPRGSGGEPGSFVSTSRCRQQQEKLEWDGYISRSE